jgi:hypothetical protein
MRTALLCLIVAVVGLTALSEIGVNVAAACRRRDRRHRHRLRFAKLVRDLITGLFLLLKNTVQVGDSVHLSGLSGRRMFRSTPFVTTRRRRGAHRSPAP